jgi:peptidoglycan/LPS O-acetylase OafA/YrhL
MEQARTATDRPRLEELDSLRGVAAFSVVLHHFTLIFPVMSATTLAVGAPFLVKLYAFSPLRIVSAGPAAVMLFFLLSGYVLSLAFLGGRRPLRYRTFLVKRVLRLYPPYLAAIAAAWVALQLAGSGRGDGALSSWYSGNWASKHIPVHDLIQHVSLVGIFDDRQLDPVTWSLAYEMRISLVFPLLMLLVRYARLPVVLLTCLAADVLGQALYAHGVSSTLSATWIYATIFVAGALLARHREALGRAWSGLAPASRAALGVLAVVAYTYQHLFPWLTSIHPFVIDQMTTAAGGCVFVVAALEAGVLSRALRTAPLRFLGRISYSLYLVHCIVLLTLLHLSYGRIPVVVLLLAGGVLSLVLGWVGYVLVEKPSIALGRRLSAPSGPGRPAARHAAPVEVTASS